MLGTERFDRGLLDALSVCGIQVPDVRPGSPPGEQGGPDTAEQYRTAVA